MSKEPTFDELVARLVDQTYPWARLNVVEAEVAGKRSLRRVWIESIRNGLDDFITALRFQREGRIEDAFERLRAAETHFMAGACEAWMQTAATKAARLHQLVRSVGTVGNYSEARKHWDQAQNLLVKARSMANHDKEAARIAKEAALAAIAGVDLLVPEAQRHNHTYGIWGVGGAGIGAVCGTLVGGAPGAVVGAILGSLLGYVAGVPRRKAVPVDDD